MKKDSRSSTSPITLLGEGRDEWHHRYFKFGVRGSDTDIPPFSAKEILDSPNHVFGQLTDAGANAFQKSARNDLLRQLDKRNPESPKFNG
jgi:hypothetical protein